MLGDKDLLKVSCIWVGEESCYGHDKAYVSDAVVENRL